MFENSTKRYLVRADEPTSECRDTTTQGVSLELEDICKGSNKA